MRRNVFMFFTFVILSGCASVPVFLTPVRETNASDKDYVFFNGNEVVVSRAAFSTVSIYGKKLNSNEILLRILFSNDTEHERFDIIPGNIKVYAFDDYGKYRMLKVFNADEYMARITNKQEWALAFTALAGSLEAASAGRSTSNTSGKVNTGRTSSTYESRTETVDQSKVSEAQARSNQEVREISREYAAANASFDADLLRANTLFPNRYVEGNVIVESNYSNQNRIMVEVPCGTDRHVFTFTFREGRQ